MWLVQLLVQAQSCSSHGTVLLGLQNPSQAAVEIGLSSITLWNFSLSAKEALRQTE